MPETKKRERNRKGYVMVELTQSERAKLEQLKAEQGERGTLAGTIRKLILEAKG